MREWTELALTLGTWGAPPPGAELQVRVLEGLAEAARAARARVRVELYGDRNEDREALAEAVRLRESGAPLEPVLRLEPRSDRFEAAARAGVREVVFEAPVSFERAWRRLQPFDVDASPVYASWAAREAALAGLRPEIALADITRAEPEDVVQVLRSVARDLTSRGVRPRWRVVDGLGLAGPPGGARLPRSLAGWVRLLRKQGGAEPGEIAVQAADTLGLGLANLLAGCRAGASPAASLFGLGHGAGWAASEAALLHRFGLKTDLRALVRLKPLLDPGGRRRDGGRPLASGRAWQVPAGTTPEDLGGRLAEHIPFDPEPVLGVRPEPLLTDLSGHAGVLHLLHRHYPAHHFETGDPRILAISEEFERQFHEGRQQPVSWEELEPIAREAGVLPAGPAGEGGE